MSAARSPPQSPVPRANYRNLRVLPPSEDAMIVDEIDDESADEGVAGDDATDAADDAADDLAAEVFAMHLSEQLIDPADLSALEADYGMRPGAREYFRDGRESWPTWTEPDDEKIQCVVRRYHSRELDLNEFVYRFSGVAWGVCAWGSCQYSTALAMFRALIFLKRKGYDPTAVLGWGPAALLAADSIPVAAASARISAGLVEVITERAKEDGTEPDPEELAKAAALRELPSLDDAFDLMRDLSWDLWSAVSHTAHMTFATEFAEVATRVAASPGIGPCADILAQSENYTTALRCYLLVAGGFITNPISFAGFST